ncbi:ABC transporter substrate-binding protein [Nitriliruptor alkaliphilus]|uniref:ABC transporter substrate-binding protein n=1 Tax=Nitriliruptor alkaliphilus TaxID=427918 RepID=UPI0006985F8C|nr:ABC transporter substrate-binding protein [Nitriliruptor alkaliphilus]
MRKHTRWVAAFAATSLLLAACGDGNGDDTAATDGDAPDLAGAEVSIFGAPSSVEADAINAVIDEYFNQPTGANAFYEGSDSFEEQIVVRVQGGNAPDIALYPQPGAVIEQAQAGNAVSLEELGFDIAELEDRFGEYLLGLGEYEGEHYGIPTNANLKSLVWYNIPVFEAEGYDIPETYEDMVSLSEQMVEDGYTPWAIGTGSDAATGWPATDWLEDIVLRQAGPENYDQWVTNELAFDSPEITEAMETFGEIVFGDGFVIGGPQGIPDLDFRDAPDAIIGDEPAALMHRQASFIVNFFPEGAEFGTDYGVFPFPSVDGNQGALIAGELAVVFRDAPEVKEFIEIFTGEEAQCAGGDFADVSRISPNVNTTADCYRDEVVATSAETILSALQEDTARFDASDLMPSEVGAGSFWSGMNEWMRGGGDTDAVLSNIQASWPN